MIPLKVDMLIINAGQMLTLKGKTPRAGEKMNDLSIIKDAALAVKDGSILAVGKSAEIKTQYTSDTVIDAKGGVVTPGFVDAHTHLVFGRTREDEFARRLKGEDYVQIAKAGGGIRSTIKTTQESAPDKLYEDALRRLRRMMQQGTTTIESKSGYGLTVDSELIQLEVIDRLNSESPADVIPTFLGAHEFPAEYANDHERYIDILINEMIPSVQMQGIARFCDIFTEAHVYNIEQSRRVLTAAKDKGLMLKMHADEIEPMGGAELAAEMRCISADHLGATSDAGMEAMLRAGVVPVLLPATLFTLRKDRYAPARRMIDIGLPVAIATDFNPGSCNCDSMPFVLSLSCLKMNMTPEEVITAATINAACAIGMEDKVGSLEKDKQADILIWDADSYNFIPFHLGKPYLKYVIKKGNIIDHDPGN